MSIPPNNAMNCLDHRWIAVCMGTGCMSSASTELREALQEELAKHNLNGLVEVLECGAVRQQESPPDFRLDAPQ